MPYLSPQFEQDVFVSYSHGDPRSTNKPLKEWTLELVRALEDDVWKDPDFSSFYIWRDEDLDPTSQLTAEIKERVRSSAILFIIMSKHYLKSRWCSDERTWFREQIQDRRAHERGRVFIIRMEPTDESKWPAFLRDERGFPPNGFRFHDWRSDTPYCWRGSHVNYDGYVQSLGMLRTTLIKHLRELRLVPEPKAHAKMQAESRHRDGGRPCVYLHTRTEDAPIREELGKLLSKEGIVPYSRVTTPGEELLDWTRETQLLFEHAKRCDALALVRVEGDENFFWTVKDIGVDERVKIEEERGFSLPCAVLDQSGKELPTDISEWGIERFDLRNDLWRCDFRQWLYRAEQQSVVAPP